MQPAHKVALCPVGALYPGTSDRFEVDGYRIALVNIADRYYAIGDTCTHADFLLSDGEVDCDNRTIECWKHGALFSVETGEALTWPASCPTASYPVVIEDDQVVVVLP